jgi:hypothetical protein
MINRRKTKMTKELEQGLVVWVKRCEALEKSIEDLLNQFRNGSIPANISRRETICHLLQSLRIFGESHFNYFHHGFLNDRFELRDKSEKENKYPPARVLRAITDQIAFDLEVITRALDQRHPYGGYTNMKDTLAIADRLGQMALRPALELGNLIDPKTTVLTYFQKSFSVRIVPYANVAIIGIPFTALHLSRDYLAIPHEVAHYIYRRGNWNGRAISLALKDKIPSSTPKYLRHWVEELFADIYGCLIAGPVMAIDFQDLQLDDPWPEFQDASKDYEDPVPILRPDTYSKILGFCKEKDEEDKCNKPLNDKWRQLARLLQNRWDKRRNDYLDRPENSPDETLTFKAGNGKEIVLTNIREPGIDLEKTKLLDDLIAQFMDGIFAPIVQKVTQGGHGYLAWSGGSANLDVIINLAEHDLEKLEKLYDEFDDLYGSIQEVETAAMVDVSNGPVVYFPDLSCDTVSVDLDSKIKESGVNIHKHWVDYVKEWTKRNDYEEITDMNKVAELLKISKRKALAKDDKKPNIWGWVELAYADGWVTRGPEPNPTGPPGV